MVKDDWEEFIEDIEVVDDKYSSKSDFLRSNNIPSVADSVDQSIQYKQKIKEQEASYLNKLKTKIRVLSPRKAHYSVNNDNIVLEYRDKKLLKKIDKGILKIDDMIDFHNNNTDVIKDRLYNFLVRAHNNDLKMVLVITGKSIFNHNHYGAGDIMPNLTIKRLVLQLFFDPELMTYIRGYAVAPKRLGGSGAFCVFLR